MIGTQLGKYRIIDKIGEGSMGTVWKAEDPALDRLVAVKTLSGRLTEDDEARERFLREAQATSSLNHPGITTVYDLLESDGQGFLVMEYIEGKTVRDMLESGRVSVRKAVDVVLQTTEALGTAHSRGILHRDIKSANLMVTMEGRVKVTDFGLAHLEERSRLTRTGTTLGTLAYASPEQITGRGVDRRSEIWSLGVVFYELLTGRLPFQQKSEGELVFAIMNNEPEPVEALRPEVNGEILTVLGRMLEKEPDRRYADCEELLHDLRVIRKRIETSTTTLLAEGAAASARRANPLRVFALYALATIGILAIVQGLLRLTGLPGWLFPWAIGLLIAGLPVVVFTGLRERRRALATLSGETITTERGIVRHFRWQRTLPAMGAAFLALALAGGGYVTMRTLGFGPLATLAARGTVSSGDSIVVADFEDAAGSPALAAAVTEALRIDLGQSTFVRVLEGSALAEILQRMGRSGATPVDDRIAAEVAQREGAKVFVSGQVGTVGSGYQITARVISASTGEVVVPLRETARDEHEVLPAVDRLSARLREELGESLRTIRASPPLPQVTTSSLEALRLYAEAYRAEFLGDLDEALQCLQAAVACDSTFAMAYAKMSSYLRNRGERSGARTAAQKAFEYRHRLPQVERYLAEASYYRHVQPDPQKRIEAYRAALRLDPEIGPALNNLGFDLELQGRFSEAEELYLKHIAVHGPSYRVSTNAVRVQAWQSKLALADSTLLSLLRVHEIPVEYRLAERRALAVARGDFAGATAVMDSLLEMTKNPLKRAEWLRQLADLAELQGRFAMANRYLEQCQSIYSAHNDSSGYLECAIRRAQVDLTKNRLISRLGDGEVDPADALAGVSDALRIYPVEAVSTRATLYSALAALMAELGDPRRSRELMTRYEQEILRGRKTSIFYLTSGRIALAEGRYPHAVEAFERHCGVGRVPLYGRWHLAMAYRGLGDQEKALSTYEAYLSVPPYARLDEIADGMSLVLLDAAELYEARGERMKARELYERLLQHWKDADPELGQIKAEVRTRLADIAEG